MMDIQLKNNTQEKMDCDKKEEDMNNIWKINFGESNIGSCFLCKIMINSYNEYKCVYFIKPQKSYQNNQVYW